MLKDIDKTHKDYYETHMFAEGKTATESALTLGGHIRRVFASLGAVPGLVVGGVMGGWS
ncbi:MAG: hypothetical protein SFT91_01780 [Rickettsiaceae bacterium]|nr:hypothetical protein [Rickettsiaceae bacterium]